MFYYMWAFLPAGTGTGWESPGTIFRGTNA